MDLKKKNILIVDDEKININLLKNLIVKDNYNIFEATTGQDALNIVEKINIDLVFLDVMLPDIDGFQVCLKLKRIAKSYIPVIFVTSMAENLDVLKKIFDCQGDDYIRKPVDIFTIKLKMQSFLRFKEVFDSLAKSREFLEQQINSSLSKANVDKSSDLLNKINLGIITYNKNGVVSYENNASVEFIGSVINDSIEKVFKSSVFLSGKTDRFSFFDNDYSKEMLVSTSKGKTLSIRKVLVKDKSDLISNCLVLREVASDNQQVEINHKTLKSFLSSF